MNKILGLFLVLFVLLIACDSSYQETLEPDLSRDCDQKTDVWILVGYGPFDFGPSDCYYEIAVEKRDLEVCNNINETVSPLRDFCIDTVKRLILFDERDPTVCEELSLDNTSYQHIKQFYEREGLGGKITTEGKLIRCYWEYVETYGDQSVCQLLTENQLERERCNIIALARTAILEENPEICATIKVDTLKDRCYEDYAIARGNVNACLSTNDGQTKARCLDTAGFYDLSLSVENCKMITESFGASRCLQRIAWNTQDATVCQLYSPVGADASAHNKGCDLMVKRAKDLKDKPVNNTKSSRDLYEIPPVGKIYDFGNIYDIKDKEWSLNPYAHN